MDENGRHSVGANQASTLIVPAEDTTGEVADRTGSATCEFRVKPVGKPCRAHTNRTIKDDVTPLRGRADRCKNLRLARTGVDADRPGQMAYGKFLRGPDIEQE